MVYDLHVRHGLTRTPIIIIIIITQPICANKVHVQAKKKKKREAHLALIHPEVRG